MTSFRRRNQRTARARARDYETKTVNPALVEQFVTDGGLSTSITPNLSGCLGRSHQQSSRRTAWTLLSHAVPPALRKGWWELVLEPKNPASPTTQIDVAALDDEIAIAIECKSSASPSKRTQFQNDLAKHGLIRERFTGSARSQFPAVHKRQVVLAMVLSNILLSENDRTRAKDQNIALLDELDLLYYEHLVAHLGPAARYQFLADMLPGNGPWIGTETPCNQDKNGWVQLLFILNYS